jgi:hypothetical protein
MRLSRRKAARFVILGALATLFAAYGASAIRSTWARAADPAAGSPLEMQTSNAAAKTDKNAFLVRDALDARSHGGFSLASATTAADLDRFYDLVTASLPAIPPGAGAAPASAPERAAEPAHAAAAPPPPEKPKRLPPPPPAAAQPTGLLDDAQIAGIKTRLRLTPAQAEYWPAVESALRTVARTQLRGLRRNPSGKASIDVNSTEVQQLIWAAMPLLMQLREDQKREVRKLVRVIGLDQVASQI